MTVMTKHLTTSAGIALFSIGLLASAPAAADNCDYAVTQADMNGCIASQAAAADRQLNYSYQNLQRLLNKTEKNQLKIAQRSWIAHRDQSCKFSTRGSVGGSAYGMELSSCILDYTKHRTKELDAEIKKIQN